MNVAALNRKRTILRYSSIAVAAIDLIAILMIMMGLQLPGVIIGLAALVGGAIFKSRGKKAFGEECCRLQTIQALGLKDGKYLGEKKETEDFMYGTHLVPSSSVLMQPLLLHAINGKMKGIELQIAEITIGCREANKKQPTYSSGVLVRATLDKPCKDAALLLGRYAFKHAALRAEYEKDGLRLSPAGGKEKGWYALTEGAVSPDEALLEKWEAVCTASKQRAALYVGGNELTAFFNGQFYTGEFPLDEEVTESMLKRHSFAAIVPLVELIESLNG